MTAANHQISAFLSERITDGDFPSAVYLVSQGNEVIFADALGNSVLEPYRVAATLDTIYDLASLTKPLITGLLCSRRIELGELTPDSSVGHYLPEFDRTDKQMITVRELLTHSSGLPAWRPLYILAEGEAERALGVIANLELEYKPGSRVIYSDLGFIALGKLLERITGHSFSELARHEIFDKLELQQTFFNPEIEWQTRIAASETGNRYEQEASEVTGEYKNWRQRVIWGEVHDGNAYFLGGAAGHAGLFSTAQETLKLAQQFLANRSLLLRPETCQMFHRDMTRDLDEARSIGWQLAETKGSTAGLDLPPDSFGHTGFTGTSCWIDYRHERILILLTNRTHARQLPFANINAVRRQFHSLAVTELNERTFLPPDP